MALSCSSSLEGTDPALRVEQSLRREQCRSNDGSGGTLGQSFVAPGGRFQQLFAGSPSRIFPGLESIYGSSDLGSWSAARRQGVLGLSGLLAARAAPNGSDPVKRGIMVRVQLLCEQMPPPIPNADFSLIMVTDDMQTRESFEALCARVSKLPPSDPTFVQGPVEELLA